MKDFFAYGTVELIEPEPNIAEWLTEEVVSPGVR